MSQKMNEKENLLRNIDIYFIAAKSLKSRNNVETYEKLEHTNY